MKGIPGTPGPRGLPGPAGEPGHYDAYNPHYDYVETAYVQPHHPEPPVPHYSHGGHIFVPGKLKRESVSSDQAVGASAPDYASPLPPGK